MWGGSCGQGQGKGKGKGGRTCSQSPTDTSTLKRWLRRRQKFLKMEKACQHRSRVRTEGTLLHRRSNRHTGVYV